MHSLTKGKIIIAIALFFALLVCAFMLFNIKSYTFLNTKWNDSVSVTFNKLNISESDAIAHKDDGNALTKDSEGFTGYEIANYTWQGIEDLTLFLIFTDKGLVSAELRSGADKHNMLIDACTKIYNKPKIASTLSTVWGKQKGLGQGITVSKTESQASVLFYSK